LITNEPPTGAQTVGLSPTSKPPALPVDYLLLLKRNLEEIVSPFTNKLSKEFMILTPVEVQICNMIKNGLSTKEIAKLRGISPATVSRHREHIRKKLGITKKEVNLATYLSALMAE
jgi:DNA-binding CsgD family transcriptional regulator